METITFKQLLAESNPFGITQILIPKIQRGYAQGRTNDRATRTRTRFLKSIYDKITAGRTLTLDFIYGHIDSQMRLIPLDGQQRLTTLWLLHWYTAKREGIDYTNLLKKFSYDTRYSSRDFIEQLAGFTPNWEESPSEEIQNEGWFPLDWATDPTVSGMLVMLNDIHELFKEQDKLWGKLDLINFHFMPLDELSLTDEIYIKMNSRGKPLTDFEHFKAELLKVVRAIDDPEETLTKRIGRKIDLDWTEMLWPYRSSDNIIDDEFLHLFRVVCRLITYRDDNSFSEVADFDDFQLINKFFTGTDARRNVAYLEDFLDAWAAVAKSEGIAKFFAKYLSLDHEEGKAIPLGNDIDLFNAGIGSTPSLQWLTSFYAFVVFLRHRDEIADADFRRRLRIILNLQKNSGNEVVDTPKADAGNRMPAILRQVETIVVEGTVNRGVSATFNVPQLTEEAEKLAFTAAHPEHAEPLFRLEDHELLKGKTMVVGHENVHLYNKFARLFECSRDAVDCAMLAVCDYSQRHGVIIQLGSGNDGDAGLTAWHNLFHPTEKTGNVANTIKALRTVLERFDAFDDATLYAYAEEYEHQCEESNRYDWRYYYLHYGNSFRPCYYGRYTQPEDKPYEMVAIYARKYESSNAYQCFLAEIDYDNIDETRWLAYKNGWLYCENDRFQYYDQEAENVLAELEIPQEDGIDTVDRIAYFKSHPLT